MLAMVSSRNLSQKQHFVRFPKIVLNEQSTKSDYAENCASPLATPLPFFAVDIEIDENYIFISHIPFYLFVFIKLFVMSASESFNRIGFCIYIYCIDNQIWKHSTI